MKDQAYINQLKEIVGKVMPDVRETGRFLWENPEIANREYKGSNFLAQKYKDNGFRVFRGVGGFPTSFMAKFSHGDSGVKIGIFSDFDALPGLSTVNEGSPGHGCSHNLYAATALGAAIMLKEVMIKGDIHGQVTVIGAPAEEAGGSKQYFVNQGLLDEFDAFFGVHPVSHVNGVMYKRHISSVGKSYRFTGLTAHAALAPEKGRNALSAMEYMNIGVNYLRGQIPSDVRINYYVKHGGVASNIIPDYTEVVYSVRAETLDTLEVIEELVDNIAACAAKAMGCTLHKNELMRFPNSIPNGVLAELAQENAKRIGSPKYTEDIQRYVKDMGYDKGYLTEIVNIPEEPTVISGSTDEASASWIAPWIRIALASIPQGAAAHTKELNALTNLDWAYIGIEKTVLVTCMTMIDLLKDVSIVKRAMDELEHSKYRVGNNVVKAKLTDKVFPQLSGLTLHENSITVDLDKVEIFSELSNCDIKVYSNDELIGQYSLNDERQFSIELNRDKAQNLLEVKFFDEEYWCTFAYLYDKSDIKL